MCILEMLFARRIFGENKGLANTKFCYRKQLSRKWIFMSKSFWSRVMLAIPKTTIPLRHYNRLWLTYVRCHSRPDRYQQWRRFWRCERCPAEWYLVVAMKECESSIVSLCECPSFPSCKHEMRYKLEILFIFV